MVFFELIQRFECCVANFADKNIAVTNGMKKWLDINNQKQNTIVYHDYALAEFHQRTIKEMYEVFNLVFSDKFQEFRERYNPIIIKEADSLIEEKERTLSYAKQRPVVGISATSWTSDEDFDLFLLAIIKCEDKIMKLSPSKFAKFPTVYIFITGRGPLRKIFEEKLKNHILKIFKISTCWLSRENYIKLLGSVDFGISLHTSTSKIDFPMKIIEMLASGLPVLSYDYEWYLIYTKSFIVLMRLLKMRKMVYFLQMITNFPRNYM